MVLVIILGEIISMIGTKRVIELVNDDQIVKIGQKGFKLDPEKSKKIIDEENEKYSRRGNKFTRLIRMLFYLLLFLTPGVNMLVGYISTVRDGKKARKALEENEGLIPMNDIEKICFANADTKEEQIKMVQNLSARKQKIVRVADPKDLTIINGERLVALGYTLDEVKRLSDGVNLPFRLGKIDDINTAVIGVPEKHPTLKKVMLTGPGERVDGYDFKPMSLEDAQGERFIVYPYRRELEKDLDKVVHEIIAARNKQEMDFHGRIDGQRRDYNTSMEMSGPELKRILR